MRSDSANAARRLLLFISKPNAIPYPVPPLIRYMAAFQSSLPKNIGLGHGQTTYQPGLMDFGFDAPASPDHSDAEIDAALDSEGDDYGFDDPLPLEHEQSGMDGVLPSEEQDFGTDASALLPPEVRQFAGIDAAPLPEAQGDDDFGMDAPLPPDGQESFGGPPKARGRT